MSNLLDILLVLLAPILVFLWILRVRYIENKERQRNRDDDLWTKKVKIDENWLKSEEINLNTPHGYIEEILRIDKQHIYAMLRVTKIKHHNGNTALTDALLSVPVDKLTLLSEGGEKLPRTEKKAKRIMRMPRLFRYIVYAAIGVLIWKFVINIEEMTQFLVNITLLHK